MGELLDFGQFINESFDVNKARIFQDMDGCLTNFEKKFLEIPANTEKLSMDKYIETHGSKAAWDLITTQGMKYWSDMEWMPDGQELWDYVKKYDDTTILTSPSRDYMCYRGKWKWINDHLPEITQEKYTSKSENGNWDKNTRAIINNHKHLFCADPNWILIDDSTNKIDKWKGAGGIGILHTDAKSTIEKLKALGL